VYLKWGGHIGFTSLYFAKLVTPSGKVIVFEPGPNNFQYIKTNTSKASNILLEEAGCSDLDVLIWMVNPSCILIILLVRIIHWCPSLIV